MKLFHLSDLHIGKLLCGYSLKENQERVLSQIVAYAQEEHPDAILICGDIYDKSAPSGEAYVMFDRFLEALSEIRPRIPVLIIAGNHDSPERLSYACLLYTSSSDVLCRSVILAMMLRSSRSRILQL